MSRKTEGIETYETKDSLRVMLLHYSADPDKNTGNEHGRAWIYAMKKGWPGGTSGPKWQQEMEINFGAVSGKRVFPWWDEMVGKLLHEPFDIPDNWPIYAAYDYGISNPFSFGVYAFKSQTQVYKIDEIVKSGANIYKQAALIKSKPYWNRVKGHIVGDPSVWHKTQHVDDKVTSIGEILEGEGIYIEKARNDTGCDATFINMLRGMLWADIERPMFKIFNTCKATINCYRNLRWDENRTVMTRELKDEPEGIIRKGVDPFDSDKYFFLSNGFDEPGKVDFRPGTWGWYEDQIREAASVRARVYG